MAGFEIAREDSVQAVKAYVEELIGNVGNEDDSGATQSTGTLMGKVNALFGIGVVKSVQYQYWDGGKVAIDSHTFEISPINPAKAFVIIDGRSYLGSTGASTWAVTNITETSITIGGDGNNGSQRNIYYSIQVIEFY